MPEPTSAAPAASAPASAPAASAPSSAPAPSSSPAAAPSATPVTSTPAATPATAPQVNAPAPITRDQFPTQEAYAAALLKEEFAGIPSGETTPDPQQQAATETDTRPPETEAKPAETPAAETTPVEGEDDFVFDLDAEDAPVDPEAFSKLLEANPELSQVLEANPELKDTLYRATRDAAELKPYKEMFPDVESAKFARDQATTFVDVRNTFLNSTTPEGAANTLNKIAELCYERDDQGQVVKDAAGNPVIGEDFFGFVDHTVRADLDHRYTELKAEIAANKFPNDEARDKAETVFAALEVLRDELGDTKAPDADPTAVPEHLRQREAELERRENALKAKEQDGKVSDRATFEKGVVSKSQDRMRGAISKVLDSVTKQGAAIAPFVRQALVNSIGTDIVQAMRDNPKVQADLQELQRLPANAESERRRLEVIDKVIQDHLPRIAKLRLREAGVQTLKNSEAKRNRIAAQEQASRNEPKGSAGNVNPQAGGEISEDVAFDRATEFWQKQNPGKTVDRDAKGRIAILAARVLSGQMLA